MNTPSVFKGRLPVAGAAPVSRPDPLASLWNTKTTYEWLGISPRKLTTEVKLGRIRHVRFGRALRFFPADVVAYAQARAKGGLIPVEAAAPAAAKGGEHAGHQ